LYDTLELAKVLKQKDSVFIIGWPYWVDEEKIKNEIPSIKEISFGAITLPHWLAKLTLVEQLYRVSTIWIWKKYHY
jgi:23S rRNA pseudoU1915 N3-methylase RlmH